MQEAKIGIIGGTGLGDALLPHITDAKTVAMETPFGKTSGPLITGRLGERQIVFLNRHGKGHKLSPSVVPYAANVFAMKKLGVRTLLASGAVGSLREHIEPGHLVVVDQFIDKTYRRLGSFFDDYGAVHCEFDQPCCSGGCGGRFSGRPREPGPSPTRRGPMCAWKARCFRRGPSRCCTASGGPT